MLQPCFLAAVALAAADVNDTSFDTDMDLEENFQETVIFLKAYTNLGQKVFVRGGIGNGKDCAPDGPPEDDPCAIPISHLELDMDSETPERDRWAEADLFLTWGKLKVDDNLTVDGTPAQWTTSDQSKDYFHGLNSYGDHYWLVHFDMDCSKLDNGFFDLKGFLSGSWEADINQGSCDGDGAEAPGYVSNNHIARCGYINIFEWDKPDCTIKSF